MKRVRLGVYIPDREYGERFTSCLVNHYRQQLELHIFTEREALLEAAGGLDVVLVELAGLAGTKLPCPVVCLYDPEVEQKERTEQGEGGVCLVEKYQEVNRIVDEILKQIGEEIRGVQQGKESEPMQMLAVYSLSENEYQLPLAVTLASILSEKESVLLLDLQENSGLSQLGGEPQSAGLEELLVMAESGKFALGRMVSCIGRLDQADYVYPAENTECLCEAGGEVYQRLIRVLAQERGYRTVILNLGSRFVGFFDMLNDCQHVYLMKGRGGLGQWRQKEFLHELENHGYLQAEERLHEIELPVLTGPVVSCERLVEQWKWNEFGDSIRRMMPGVAVCG
ncbi:MAG: hypothetical protein NC355_00565 [Blautia sp.]|nr:hypothetical protein [Blautia sp.]